MEHDNEHATLLSSTVLIQLLPSKRQTNFSVGLLDLQSTAWVGFHGINIPQMHKKERSHDQKSFPLEILDHA